MDAYPFPRIDEIIEKSFRYDVYSTLDLKSAYHQIPIRENEKQYTAFEAHGNLYQFCRIPFGVTNGVACIDDIINKEQLSGTFAYVDNLAICGTTVEEHDENLEKLRSVAKRYGITFNDAKSIIRTERLNILGYEVSKHIIKPDPERFRRLKELLPRKA